MPATAMIGPRIAQRVEPLMALPPMNPSPCNVKTAPSSATTMPMVTSTALLMGVASFVPGRRARIAPGGHAASALVDS
jgi:hypothetical protein